MNASERGRRVRRRLSRLLLVVAAVALLQGLVSAYAAVVLADPGAFADRVERARQDEDIRRFVAARIADRLVEHASPDAIAARPLLAQSLAAALASPTLTSVVRIAAVQLHATLVDPAAPSAVLDLADAGVVAAGALRAAAPQLAASLPAERSASFRLLMSERGVPPAVTGIAARAPRLALG